MILARNLRLSLAALTAVGGLAFASPRTLAQPPGGGGFQPTPQMRAMFQKMQKWRDDHQKHFALGDLLYQINEMHKDSRYALTKPQASKILGAIRPWEKKSDMTQDQAAGLIKTLSGTLTEKQLKKTASIEPPSRRMRRGGGGGGGRPGGGAPGGGGRPGGPPGGFQMPDLSKGYNPLNPETMPFEMAKPRVRKMMEEINTALAKAAKG